MKHAVTHFVVLCVYTLLACILLFPLPFHLDDGLVAAESGDPLLQVWVIQWNIHKLSTSISSYFDANIFYPYQNTFAYHDHMFGLGLFGLPLYALSHNPILTYNILFLFSFVFSAYGMFLLVKELTHHSYAAWIAGFIFGFLPYRFAHLDHLNLLSIYWLSFCFLFITRYFFSASRTTAKISSTIVLFYLCFILQALTSFNYLFFSTIALGIYGGILFILRWKTRSVLWRSYIWRDLTIILGGALLTVFVLLPLARPYLKANQNMGFERSITETVDLSARWRDYGVAPDSNLLYGKWTRAWQSASPYAREQILFPGILPILLAFLAIAGVWKSPQPSSLNVFRIAYFFILLVAFILSFGPFLTIAGNTFSLPYSWLYHYLPGFKSMRVPARFGLLVSFSLTVLAGIGFSQIETLLNQRKGGQKQKKVSRLAFILVSGILLVEYWSLPLPVSLYSGNRHTIPAVYQWLAKQPDDCRLIELPASSPKDNFEAMYYSTFHWKRLVNGRSAFIPEGITKVFDEMRRFPSQRTIKLLQKLDIDYVLWHKTTEDDDIIKKLPNETVTVQQFGDDSLIELDPTPLPNAILSETPILQSDYRVPLSLQSGALHTAGLQLTLTAPQDFSPLPEERSRLQIEWFQENRLLYHESVRALLPVFFEKGESAITPLRFSTPPISGIFKVVFYHQDPRFEHIPVTKRVTLFSDIVDSRRPEKLQAEFLQIDVPDVWKPGKALPVRVLIKNSGNTLWKAWIPDRQHPIGEVRLGVVEWHNAATGEKLMQQRGASLGARGLLVYDLAPGQEAWVETEIPTPHETGEFFVEFDMVSELIQWFSHQNSPTVRVNVRLE